MTLIDWNLELLAWKPHKLLRRQASKNKKQKSSENIFTDNKSTNPIVWLPNRREISSTMFSSFPSRKAFREPQIKLSYLEILRQSWIIQTQTEKSIKKRFVCFLLWFNELAHERSLLCTGFAMTLFNSRGRGLEGDSLLDGKFHVIEDNLMG